MIDLVNQSGHVAAVEAVDAAGFGQGRVHLAFVVADLVLAAFHAVGSGNVSRREFFLSFLKRRRYELEVTDAKGGDVALTVNWSSWSGWHGVSSVV